MKTVEVAKTELEITCTAYYAAKAVYEIAADELNELYITYQKAKNDYRKAYDTWDEALEKNCK